MQPTKRNSKKSEKATIFDWVREQFSPTSGVEVQNILDHDFYFEYCVDEDVETPDEFSRKVKDRRYESKTFTPGESLVIVGAAAYIFLEQIAREYVFNTSSDAKDTGKEELLVEAAQKALIGEVGFAQGRGPAAPSPRPQVPIGRTESVPADHNPNNIPQADPTPVAPQPVQPPVQTPPESEEFSDALTPPQVTPNEPTQQPNPDPTPTA